MNKMMNHRFPVLQILLMTALLGSADVCAELGFPDYLKFSPKIQLNSGQSLVKENLAEAEFASDASGANMVSKRGVHYQRWLSYVAAAGEPQPGYYNGTEERIYQALQSTFAGWQAVFISENKSSLVMRKSVNGKDVWASVDMDAPQAQLKITLIEVGAAANELVLQPPATIPEKILDTTDFPYLPPYPNSQRTSAGQSADPLDVRLPGTPDAEAKLVASGFLYRNFQGPKTLSALQFIGEYRYALTKAGWLVVYPSTDIAVKDAASVIAHYDQHGRNIWVKLMYEYGASLSYQVADIGADDWSAKFSKDCQVPLYGVFFDFNKATLKPESNSALSKALALLQKNAASKIEVQGHTDNVGTDQYNNALSTARAAAVMAWLSQHGVAAARMSAKGYGKTQPLADNNTDVGRAKNRRVALRNLACAK
jgi:OmpA-OmpF porin, OOP family